MNMEILNIPTLLTLFRLLVSPLCLPFLMVYGLPYNNIYLTHAIAVFFAILGFTDFLDGYLARKFEQVTLLGKALDPIADKFLLFSALISLIVLQKLYFYWAIILIGREFFIMGLRIVALENNLNVDVSWLGKFKTIAQLFYITFAIIDSPYTTPCLAIAVILSVVSAYFYYRSFMQEFAQKKFLSVL